jgi:hypothetical protein
MPQMMSKAAIIFEGSEEMRLLGGRRLIAAAARERREGSNTWMTTQIISEKGF